MPVIIVKKEVIPSLGDAKNKPVVIKWKGVDMIRNHSIKATANDIVQAITNSDLISINVIGKQGTGKTTIAKVIAHLVHSMSDIPFAINVFGKEELINLGDTVANLTPTNQIIIFDDVSFLGSGASKKQLDMIQSVLTTIRHLPGGKDVKIILIKNFHYTKAVSPFLRQNDFTYISSVDPNEVKNLNDLLGADYSRTIDMLADLRSEALLKNVFTIKLGKKFKFTYYAKKPFLPYIYTNGRNTRIVVCPTREWIQPICSICSAATSEASLINVEKFKEEFDKAFGDHTTKYIVKQMLKEQGITTYGKTYTQGRRYLDKALELKQFNLEDLAVQYGIKITKTRLDMKPSGVLLE